MSIETPAISRSPAPKKSLMDYFVPPLVIPVAIVLALLLFTLIHGPVT